MEDKFLDFVKEGLEKNGCMLGDVSEKIVIAIISRMIENNQLKSDDEYEDTLKKLVNNILFQEMISANGGHGEVTESAVKAVYKQYFREDYSDKKADDSIQQTSVTNCGDGNISDINTNTDSETEEIVSGRTMEELYALLMQGVQKVESPESVEDAASQVENAERKDSIPETRIKTPPPSSPAPEPMPTLASSSALNAEVTSRQTKANIETLSEAVGDVKTMDTQSSEEEKIRVWSSALEALSYFGKIPYVKMETKRTISNEQLIEEFQRQIDATDQNILFAYWEMVTIIPPGAKIKYKENGIIKTSIFSLNSGMCLTIITDKAIHMRIYDGKIEHILLKDVKEIVGVYEKNVFSCGQVQMELFDGRRLIFVIGNYANQKEPDYAKFIVEYLAKIIC